MAQHDVTRRTVIQIRRKSWKKRSVMTRGTTYIDTQQLEATRHDTPRKRDEGEGSWSRTKIEERNKTETRHTKVQDMRNRPPVSQ